LISTADPGAWRGWVNPIVLLKIYSPCITCFFRLSILTQRSDGSNGHKKKTTKVSLKNATTAALLLLLAMSCKKSNNGNTASPDSFPNTVGDSWRYQVRDTTLSGSGVYANTPYTVDVQIVGTVKWPNGITAMIWQYKGPGWIDSNYVYQTGDTIRFMDITNTIIVRQYISPFVTGSSWPFIPGISNVTVLGQENITVGNNSFAGAWEIYGNAGMPDASFTIHQWFKNNVGFLRLYLNPSGELILTRHIQDWTLVSYQLK
jgi:hypothetical protein